jgi:hypothetical protein
MLKQWESLPPEIGEKSSGLFELIGAWTKMDAEGSRCSTDVDLAAVVDA